MLEQRDLHMIEHFNKNDHVHAVFIANPSLSRLHSEERIDKQLLIISNNAQNTLHYYIEDGKHIQERWMSKVEFFNRIINETDEELISYLKNSRVAVDKDARVTQIQKEIIEFSANLQEQKLFVEFCKFLHAFTQSRRFLNEGYYLDAYTYILSAIKHWAHIVIIESGALPTSRVWDQVYHVNIGVYKLYEELTSSQETVEKRVQLLLLACEFSVLAKLKTCCTYLFRLMRTKKQPWSIHELTSALNEQFMNRIDLTLLLKKLLKRGLVLQVDPKNKYSDFHLASEFAFVMEPPHIDHHCC